MEPSLHERVDQLERLISSLRHDLRGIVTPAVLIADSLVRNPDPIIQRSAARIADTVERIILRLNATYELVPARDARVH
jgi:hypothetical protein